MSPLIGLLGHRQVGKTTMLEAIAKTYKTFDDGIELARAQKDPVGFVSEIAGSSVAIDECQLAPEIFPALKDWVRRHPRPGQFILSGSVRFTSRKAIQESLTGRIVNLELLPLLISELRAKSLPNFWRSILSSEEVPKSVPIDDFASQSKSISKYFEDGGLPGICFIRDGSFRARKLESQIETLLDRDLRKIVSTNLPYPQIRLLLQQIADIQGEPFNWTDLQKASQISVPTLKKLAYGLENIFILRTLMIEGDAKGSVFVFEDVGEFNFLRTKALSLTERMCHLLTVHVRGELSYGLQGAYRLFQYRTRAGVKLQLCIQSQRDFVGIIPIEDESPSRIESAAADSFLKSYGRAKVVFVHMGKHVERISGRKLLVPLAAVV